MRSILQHKFFFIGTLISAMFAEKAVAQTELDNYNITWTTQSKNSSESMPCGGGDIGLNVWVENGDLFFYIARSGTFDENNTLLKLGRVRIKLSPNPFEGNSFHQQLNLKDGNVTIKASNGKLTSEILFWVDVFRPVVHVEIKSSSPVTTEANYETWRYKDRLSSGRSNNENSYKWAPQKVTTFKDEISFLVNGVQFYHRNNPFFVFYVTVKKS